MAEAIEGDPLRLERCPQCGYQLDGLPAEGACPECGRRYNQSVVVLHGWGRGGHANVYTSPARVAVGMWLLHSVAMFNWLANPVLRRSPWLVPMIFGWAVFTGVVLWRRRNPTLPGFVQVLLSPAGCAQLDFPTRNRLVPPTCWADISDVYFTQLNNGNYRLQTLKKHAWWWPAGTPVDAEVQLTTPQAEALRRKLDAWRPAADAPQGNRTPTPAPPPEYDVVRG